MSDTLFLFFADPSDQTRIDKLLGKAKYLEENIIVIMIYLLDGTIKETNQSCQKIAKKS